MKRTRFALFVFIACFALQIRADVIKGQTTDKQSDQKATAARELFDTIGRMDKAMFDAFNAHNAEAMMLLFTDDLEFYHDKGGLSNYRQTAESFRKLFSETPDIRRDLVDGTLEVYPVKDYGAIEIGTHRFCHKEAGKDDCGSFKFVMAWRKIGDSWKVSRVVSYGH
jgi:ketosteroid isomerase-like protein